MCAEVVYQNCAAGMGCFDLIDNCVAKFCAGRIIALWAGNNVQYLFHVVDFLSTANLDTLAFKKILLSQRIPVSLGILVIFDLWKWKLKWKTA